MPRRISDYPDAFAGWNMVSSFGSLISVIATWLFLHILYVQLVEGKGVSRYPWMIPEFYYDLLQTYSTRVFGSLEWGLSSPPKPHAFVSLPVQSVSILPLLRKLYNIMHTFIWKVVFIWYNKKVIFSILWNDRYIILRNMLDRKWFILTSIYMSLTLKYFVVFFVAVMNLHPYVALQWAGVVFAIVHLNTVCWTSSYAFKFKDFVTWVLVGTVLAAIFYFFSSIAAVILIISHTSYLPNFIEKLFGKQELINMTVLHMNPQAENGSQSSKAIVPSSQKSGSVGRPLRGTSPSASKEGTFQLPETSREEDKWLRTSPIPSSDPDVPVPGHQLHSAVLTDRLTKAGLESKYPNHALGRGQGWGYIGANRSYVILNLLNVTIENDPNYLAPFTIPPTKGEPMMAARTNFWWDLREKYTQEDINCASEEWAARHTDSMSDSQINSLNYSHDTMINIMTRTGSKQEQREVCESMMRILKEVMTDRDHRPSKTSEYWKFLHEFLAVRHYYQLFLLDNNT